MTMQKNWRPGKHQKSLITALTAGDKLAFDKETGWYLHNGKIPIDLHAKSIESLCSETLLRPVTTGFSATLSHTF